MYVSIMEMMELRYFAAVAKTQNIHRASQDIGISPGSLSKAVSRLEDELGVKLFARVGRNIVLSPEGRVLKQRAHEILDMESQARVDIAGGNAEMQVRIGGSETLLSYFGSNLTTQLRSEYVKSKFSLVPLDESQVEGKVRDGELHLGLTTTQPAAVLDSKSIAKVKFRTVLGRSHKLYRRAKKNEQIPVEELLTYDFVTPDQALLGATGKLQSLDGWRDDRFERKRTYLTSSLKTLENLVVRGCAVAYMPDYLVLDLPVEILNVSGCPYECTQKVYLITKDKGALGWLNRLF